MPAFNGDTFLSERIKQLINEFNIHTLIETGTHQANSTLEMATFGVRVHTIEISEAYYKDCKPKLAHLDNVSIYNGSSPEVMNHLLKAVKSNVLFFLDAHWYAYNPLLDELNEIIRAGIKDCVIVIHDFKNPEHPEFGFDKFPDGRPYEFGIIEPFIKQIFPKYKVEYNTQATGAMRGVVFIMPVEN